jgi:carotenoid cleavage dioxygenase-like enzyme
MARSRLISTAPSTASIPIPQFPPMYGDDIWFNGDGMVTRFTFKDGNVRLQQKLGAHAQVHSGARGRACLVRRLSQPADRCAQGQGRDPRHRQHQCDAFGDKLLALKEDSPPVLMDAETLETIEPVYTFNGQLISETFTAHPKIDPKTGNMLAFSYAAKGLLTRDMVFYEITPEHEVMKGDRVRDPLLLHDARLGFHRRLCGVPRRADHQRLGAAGKALPHFGFDKRKPIYLGVLPRNGTCQDIRWFSAPNCFASHVVNAHNEGTKVHFDTPMAEGNMFPFFPDFEGAPFEPREGAVAGHALDGRHARQQR